MNIVKKKKDISITLIFVGVFTFISLYFGNYNGFLFWINLALILICGGLCLVQFRLSDRVKNILGIASIIISPFLMYFIIESMNSQSAFSKTPIKALFSILFILALNVLFWMITKRQRVGLVISNSLLFFLALLNFYKLLFRAEPILPWDIYSISTVTTVADNYSIRPIDLIMNYTLIFLFFHIVVCKINCVTIKLRRRILGGALSLVTIVAITCLFLNNTNVSFMQEMGFRTEGFSQKIGYCNSGLIPSLEMNIPYLFISPPPDYSAASAKQIETSLANNAEKNTKEVAPTKDKPNLIVVMCEAFADLKTAGDFSTNMEVMPFYDSLKDDAQKGHLYVSTFGGGTIITEFEFLTGNSMAFLPIGNFPYYQYVTSKTNSIAWTLKSQGYQSVAIHPFGREGYNRQNAMPLMGFDQFLTHPSFNQEFVRGFISDHSFTNKIIDLYENKDQDKPLFLFGITMQNHGGYSDPDFESDVKLTDYPEQFPEVEQYLSLIHLSDLALKELVEYFSTVNEPTIVCFFGDHFPSLPNEFYSTIARPANEQSVFDLHQTPLLIWANYDIQEKTDIKLSANYLSSLLLETAGLDEPGFNQFLLQTAKKYPVLTIEGILDDQNKHYALKSKADDVALNNYQILQYNSMFDKKNSNPAFFGS